jgi:hypothetical protein
MRENTIRTSAGNLISRSGFTLLLRNPKFYPLATPIGVDEP